MNVILTNPSSDAAGSILAAGFVSRDTAEWVDRLARLSAECDRDIAAETADELGMRVPDCAREGWAA